MRAFPCAPKGFHTRKRTVNTSPHPSKAFPRTTAQHRRSRDEPCRSKERRMVLNVKCGRCIPLMVTSHQVYTPRSWKGPVVQGLVLWLPVAADPLPALPRRIQGAGCHERASPVRADTLGAGRAVDLTPRPHLRGSHGSRFCRAPSLRNVPHPPDPHPTASCATCHAVDPAGCGALGAASCTAGLGDVHPRRVGPRLACASRHDPHTARPGRSSGGGSHGS